MTDNQYSENFNYQGQRIRFYAEEWAIPPVLKRFGPFGDAGIDLFSPMPFYILPGENLVVDTGVKIWLPAYTVGLIRPRGGDNFLIGSGVVDNGYTGTIKVRVFNPRSRDLTFEKGSSLGQLVIVFKPAITGLVQLKGSAVDSRRERQEEGAINQQVVVSYS